VNRVLADPSYDDRLEDRLAAMRALVAEIVDFRNAASFALGFEWSARSTAEREEFARLFADLLQTSVFRLGRRPGPTRQRARRDLRRRAHRSQWRHGRHAPC
jgi:hypothetical protein